MGITSIGKGVPFKAILGIIQRSYKDERGGGEGGGKHRKRLINTYGTQM